LATGLHIGSSGPGDNLFDIDAVRLFERMARAIASGVSDICRQASSAAATRGSVMSSPSSMLASKPEY